MRAGRARTFSFDRLFQYGVLSNHASLTTKRVLTYLADRVREKTYVNNVPIPDNSERRKELVILSS